MARGDTQIGHAVSESEALDQVIAHLSAMAPASRADQRRLAESMDLLYALKRQATIGVHRNPTIYAALQARLGRAPTDAELMAEVQRIKDEALVEAAEAGRLPHQRRQRRRNPVLAMFGNPGRVKRAIDCGEVLSHNVQAVLYVRDDDGEEYAHGYGLDDDRDLKLTTHRDGAVTIGGLKRETGFALVGLPGGEVVICDAAEVDE